MTFSLEEEIIELALPDGNLLPSEDNDLFTSKLGGQAIWMQAPPVDTSLKCRLCGTEMFLLLQMDTPRPDEFSNSVDRIAYVFVCNTRKCSQDARGWRVFFMARRNGAVADNKKEKVVEDKKSFWDSIMNTDDNTSDNTINNTRVTSDNSSDNSLSVQPVKCNSKHHFPGIYLHIEEEIIVEKRGDKNHTGRALPEDVKFAPDAFDELTNDDKQQKQSGEEDWSGEQYEKFRAPGTDKSFSRFQKRVAHYPRQCVRYAASSTAKPLLYHDLDLNGAVKALNKCDCCGRPRDRFELQLMPAILAFIPTESEKFIAHIPKNVRSSNPMISDGMEWGSVFIYSCGDSCPLSGDSVFYEGSVIIQLELTI